MKILHLSNTPLSNAPANIASCQNHAGHESKVLLHRKSNLNKVFVGGELWYEYSKEYLTNLFESADIIHFHNFTWSQNIFFENPHLKEIVRRKKVVVQFHSPRKSVENFEDIISDPFFKGKRAVIAQYHVRQYPECEFIVPNCLPLHEDRFKLVPMGKWSNDVLVATSSPSNTDRSEWDYKGADVISNVFRRITSSTQNMQTQLITDVPYHECLARKAWSHIGVEEFFTGSYHLSFLEYLALGCFTIGYLDSLTKTALASVVGEDAVTKIPYVVCRGSSDFFRLLLQISESPELKYKAQKKAELAREWMNTHLSSTKVSSHYDKMYAAL